LTALTLLDLSVNEFSGTFPTQLSGMTSLQKLLLHDDDDVGGLTGSLPSLATFGSLKEISFDNNDLRGIIPSNFLAGITDKTKTITVSLMNNQLTGAIPKSLESFSSLDIRLEDNRISGIDVDCAKVPGWMQGQVGQLVSPDSPCNAILCPPQTYNADGKQRSGNYSICNSCPQAQYYGSTSCGESVNKEKELLDKMYKATGGQYWKKSANWTTPGVPICYREGVVCNGGLDSGVVELLMNDFGMSGKIPPEIFEDLPQVRHLGFTDNLVDLDLKYLDKAINLEVLKMSNTQLRSLKHIEKALPALSEMHFAGIQLSGTLPSQIYSLSNVQKLFLSNNLFTGTISTDISKMSALLEIYLGDNKLTGHIPSDLRNLSKLRTVDIQLNYLSGNLPESFNQLTDLEFVILQGQKGDKKISGPIISFSGSPLITTIDLSKNELTGTIPGDFIDQGSATASIKVDLSFNQIGGTLPASLSKFSNLFINLAENQIVRITDSLCSNGGWMGGKVGDLNTCNAILCGPGTAAPEGRQVSASIPCKECPEILVDAPFYGATACRSHLELNEKNILTEIYAKTNGTNWVQSTNWVSDQSVCSWYGIACNDNGVIQVNLESNGLEASSDVSELFFQLPYLRKLDIKGTTVCC
jgi:Leucine-rich repeat (LRR) protein